jgi:hypothetical protein
MHWPLGLTIQYSGAGASGTRRSDLELILPFWRVGQNSHLTAPTKQPISLDSGVDFTAMLPPIDNDTALAGNDQRLRNRVSPFEARVFRTRADRDLFANACRNHMPPRNIGKSHSRYSFSFN